MWASITYTFSPSTQIRSGEVNQDFSDLVAGIDTAMPSGGIIIWSQPIANIPGGWYLCDGANGTPNLVGKFVQGAGSGYAVGSAGGSAAHQHSGADHTHYDDHYHTVNGHAHNFSGTTGSGGSWRPHRTDSGSTQLTADHTHSYSGTTDWQAPGTNTKSGQGYGAYTSGADRDLTTGSTDTRPPFHSLAFIMKS